jgi:hypothetical protein
MWFAVDPSTRLATAPARFEGLDSGYCDTFWHHEYHDQDATQFRDLIRDGVAAASLRSATDDRPVRSVRYREFLEPQGYDDELRAVFRTGDNTWAIAALLREKGRTAFAPDEVKVLEAVSAIVGSALRVHAATAGSTPVHGSSSAPGLLMFTATGLLLSANAEAAHWMTQLCGPAPAGLERGWIDLMSDPAASDLQVPFPVIPLIASARAVANGHEPGPARLRMRDRNGRWIVLHASCLASASAADSTIAVVVEPAKSAEIAPIIIEAYGLTSRERDVVRAIARGSSKRRLAELSQPDTVRDYVKAVFEKVGEQPASWSRLSPSTTGRCTRHGAHRPENHRGKRWYGLWPCVHARAASAAYPSPVDAMRLRRVHTGQARRWVHRVLGCVVAGPPQAQTQLPARKPPHPSSPRSREVEALVVCAGLTVPPSARMRTTRWSPADPQHLSALPPPLVVRSSRAGRCRRVRRTGHPSVSPEVKSRRSARAIGGRIRPSSRRALPSRSARAIG